MLIAIIIIAVILILVIAFIGMYNGLVKLRNMVKEAYSTIDVYLKKRYDLVPNLVETVKGYAAHEKSVFEAVTEARAATASARTVEDKFQAENALTGTLKSLFAVAENYPTLQANVNFMDLQKQLQSLENEIAMSRKYYNGVVREYNTKIETVPSNIVAGITGFKQEPFFEAAEEEKGPVEVRF